MNKMCLLAYPLLLSSAVFALEPGLLRNENIRTLPRPAPIPNRTRPKPAVPSAPAKAPALNPGVVNLKTEFAGARGLTEIQLHGLHYSRVACSRRIYSGNGLSVEGDGDLKVTSVTEDLYEAEFPARLYLKRFDPYQSGIEEIETRVSLQLVKFAGWKTGKSLKLNKTVRLTFVDPNSRDQEVAAVDEFKIIGDAYPPRFIVKETVFAHQELEFYFICQ